MGDTTNLVGKLDAIRDHVFLYCVRYGHHQSWVCVMKSFTSAYIDGYLPEDIEVFDGLL